MQNGLKWVLMAFLFTGMSSYAQTEEAIEVGPVLLRPEVTMLGAYDDRVIQVAEGVAKSDVYVETAAGIRLENRPARYNLIGNARYGYRVYNEYDGLNDDFYNAGVAARSGDDPLRWGLSADLNKSLNYDPGYDPESGQTPDPILVDAPNRRFLAEANAGYEYTFSENMSLIPEYRFQQYYQEFASTEDADWQIHWVNLELRRRQTDKTMLTLATSYSLQNNPDEEGRIGSVTLGAEMNTTDKTDLRMELGYANADYEQSGTDHGFVSNLRVNWQTSERIFLYVFGGNDFRPGYSGSPARWVYRLGYGANWQIFEKVRLEASLLHDYQEVIGQNDSANPAFGEVRHFFDSRLNYRLRGPWFSALGCRYTVDERDPAQFVGFVQAGLRY